MANAVRNNGNEDGSGETSQGDIFHRQPQRLEHPEIGDRKVGARPQPKTRKKTAGRAKNRLWSIRRDAQAVEDLRRLHLVAPPDGSNAADHTGGLVSHALRNWSTVANERCGSWYVPPLSPLGGSDDDDNDDDDPPSRYRYHSPRSCYFKSTDGHANVWDFSLKRLNLELLEHTAGVGDGGCVLVDSSVRKVLPDSFSRTIPIWAAVLNRIAQRFRAQAAGGTTAARWDTNLYTPRGVVSATEHAAMSALIEERADTLFRSGAIVNPSRLVELLEKPLKVAWMDRGGNLYPPNPNAGGVGDRGGPTDEESPTRDSFVILCYNPSRYVLVETPTGFGQGSTEEPIKVDKHHQEVVSPGDGSNGDGGKAPAPYYYTPGAADDHESWARKLTPALFWRNQSSLLDPGLDEDGVDAAIDRLVQKAGEEEADARPDSDAAARSYSNKIGTTDLWIGSRRAGKPPGCWEAFDAVLNVTNQEYGGLAGGGGWYLRLPVEEGKRDRTELERWMPVGLAFLVHHLQRERRVLVHCAQGRDRSVAVALVFAVLACPLRFPLSLRDGFATREGAWDLSGLLGEAPGVGEEDGAGKDDPEEKGTPTTHLSSGLPEAIVSRLLEPDGREAFLLWVHKQLDGSGGGGATTGASSNPKRLADKESIRIALHLIRQDRDVAEPTRSTMQKINRFLMSSPIYR